MIDSNEEKNEKGVGYNSDCKAEEVNDIDKRLHLAMLFKLASIADQDSNEDMELSVRNMLEMDVVKTRYGTSRDWKDPPPDESRNELEFRRVLFRSSVFLITSSNRARKGKLMTS